MLKIRNMSVVLGVVLALFCTAALAQAPTFESDPRTGRQVAHRDVNPLDVPTAFSQNTSLDLVPFSGVACVAPGFITTENAWWRYYKLSETEVDRLASELDTVLEYAQMLQEVDTSTVEPTSHAVPLPTPMREDRAVAPMDPALAVKNAPELEGSAFSVPKVIEGEEEG